MSEDREKLESFEQDEPKDEDVEAHRKKALTDEPRSEEESDDVEAHARRAKHRSI